MLGTIQMIKCRQHNCIVCIIYCSNMCQCQWVIVQAKHCLRIQINGFLHFHLDVEISVFAMFEIRAAFLVYWSNQLKMLRFSCSSSVVCWDNVDFLAVFLGAFARLRKPTVRLVIYVRLSVRVEKLGFYWTDFHEIWYLTFSWKSAGEFKLH